MTSALRGDCRRRSFTRPKRGTNRPGWFLQALDGLTFGPGEEEGIVRNHHFYHKQFDMALTFPEGWRVDNRADRIVATSGDNDALLQVTVTDLNKRISAKEFMTQRVQLKNLQHGAAFSTNGFDGYTAIADGKTQWGMRRVRYVVLFRDTSAWLFAGAAKNSSDPPLHDAAILATATSFRTLTRDEQELASAQHLKIIKAPAAPAMRSWPESPIANYRNFLRLLNGQYPDGNGAGAWMKIVH
jgi:predicted Zn-dependent protease